MLTPMLYEASYVIPDIEGDPKKSFIFDADDHSSSQVSRSDIVYDRIYREHPTALDIHVRLMKPKEIRKLIPFEERLQRSVVRAVMRQVHILSAFDELEKAA